MPATGREHRVISFADALAAGGEVVDTAGTRNDPIEVVDYDPSWPDRFVAVRDALREGLGPTARRIDHVGSTAVAGLAAKPIIDVQISVPDVEDEAAYRPPIESLGYALRFREPEHRYFRPVPGRPRTAHIHVCTVGSDWEWSHILFRDYLRAHPHIAAEYGALKRELADHYREGRIEYNDAKGPWIVGQVQRAEAWAERTGWTVEA